MQLIASLCRPLIVISIELALVTFILLMLGNLAVPLILCRYCFDVDFISMYEPSPKLKTIKKKKKVKYRQDNTTNPIFKFISFPLNLVKILLDFHWKTKPNIHLSPLSKACYKQILHQANAINRKRSRFRNRHKEKFTRGRRNACKFISRQSSTHPACHVQVPSNDCHFKFPAFCPIKKSEFKPKIMMLKKFLSCVLILIPFLS